MTEQEAINILYDGTFHITKLGHSSMILFDEEFNEARNMAVAALEKQIPKKYIIIEPTKVHPCCYCPNCNNFIGWKAIDITFNYCSCCGQKIDWD